MVPYTSQYLCDI